ncbi:MAG: hypothetical protein Ta2B_28190 [Termitinemataceae bacterium]|nr:MAG: hypothetical protein Ta2B_28190 [Termitinemataceae bacterium]
MCFAKNRKLIFILFSLAPLFISCNTFPMTKNVVSDVGGISEINKFQYYVSSDIWLTATEIVKEKDFNKAGAAKIKETSFRDIVRIGANTMGVLMDSRIGDDGMMLLEICFEEKASDSDKRIIFKQDGTGLEQKFFISFTDPRKRILKYGTNDYSLETTTGERAFLKIQIDRSKIEKERVRRVKGRKVEY